MVDYTNYDGPLAEYITRTYFAYGGEEYQPEEESSSAKSPFSQTSRLAFNKDGDPSYIGITHMSKASAFDSSGSLFLEFRHDFNQVDFSVTLQGFHLSLRFKGFNRPCEIDSIYLLRHQDKEGRFNIGRNWIDVTGPEDKKIPGINEVKDFQEIVEESGDILFKLRRVEENIVIENFSGGQLENRFIIPIEINPEEIRDQLINPLTLRESVKAPADLDISWRFANLSTALGVKWERF